MDTERQLPVRYHADVDGSDLHELLDASRAASGVVGAAAGVLIGNHVITAESGHASLEPPVPITTETRFHIVSVTKVMVATVIGRLMSQVGSRWTIRSARTFLSFARRVGHAP
jgi:hypothetical protein